MAKIIITIIFGQYCNQDYLKQLLIVFGNTMFLLNFKEKNLTVFCTLDVNFMWHNMDIILITEKNNNK